jgi:ribonuclease R
MTQDGRKIREKIRALLARKDYRPLDKIDIAHKLGLTGGERVTLRKILRELERSGEIARIRKNRYVLPAEADLVTGTLSIHQAGYGFLITETPGEPDIFIAAENTGTAMHGDRVVARITRDEAYPRAKDRRGRREGRVIRILERARDTIVGTLQDSRNFYYVVPDDPRLVHDVYVQLPARAKLPKAPGRGDKVVVRLEPWESRHVNPEGEIVEVLGPASAPGVDMLSIIRKYDLPTEFPRPVIDEANRIPEAIAPRMLEGREDLREKFIITIDPDDARDFDDAIHVDKIDPPEAGWRLGVHIADVSAYVNPDSALDREARRRGNSVYLPDRVIPMLPERLSNGVCSLNPGVDRLTHSVFIQVDKSGHARNVRFAKSVIRSTHRLTYKQAYSILQSAPRDRLSEHLHKAWALASLLRRRRFEHGSLDLDFPEVKVHVDANGEPLKLERVENDE